MELLTLEYSNFSEKWKNDKLKTGKSWESWSFLISEFPILALGQNWKLGFEESRRKKFLRFLRFQPIILDQFLPFYPTINQKIKMLKKWKKTPADIIILYFMIICYTVHEIWHVTDVTFIFHFGQFFALYPPNIPKNYNSLKIKKMPGDIIILQMCINGKTDGQKKWHIEVGALTKKMKNWKLSQILVFHSSNNTG